MPKAQQAKAPPPARLPEPSAAPGRDGYPTSPFGGTQVIGGYPADPPSAPSGELKREVSRPDSATAPEAAPPARYPRAVEPEEQRSEHTDQLDFDEALVAICTRELEAGADDTRAARLNFEIARAVREPAKALEHYHKALELWPDHLPSIQGARKILVARGDVEGAGALFEAEIRLAGDPRVKARLLHGKGRIYEDLASDIDGALACYRRAAELDASSPSLLKALEQAEAQLGHWRELATARESAANAVREDVRHRAALVVERARLFEMRVTDVERATDLFEQALELDPDAAGALEALKRLLYDGQRWRDLNAILEREAAQARVADNRAQALFRVGRNQSDRLGNRDEGITALARAMQVAPRDSLIHEVLSQLYEAAGDHVNLASVLAHRVDAIVEPSQRLGMLHRIGELYEKRLANDESAQRWYEAALRIDATYRPVLFALDALYQRARAWQPLLMMYMAAAEATRDSDRRAESHARIADISETHLGQHEEAIRHHAQALALAPELEGSFKSLTRLYAAHGRYRELIELYERGIDRAGQREIVISYLFKIGAIYEDQLRDAPQAMHAYRRILERTPDDLGAIHALQRAAERAARHADLVDALDREAQLATEATRRVALIARAAQVLADDVGDRDAAVLRFSKALALDGRYPPALAGLGKLYHAMGRYEDLRDVYERELVALDDGREKIELLYKLGQLCEHQLRRDDDAIAYYRQAIALDPSHAPSLRELGHQLRRRGDYQGLVGAIEAELTATSSADAAARAAYRLGEVHEVHLDQLDEAALAYERSMAAVVHYRPAVDALIRVRTKMQQWDQLVALLVADAERATEPRYAIDDLMRAGQVFDERLDKPEQAVSCYERVLAIDDSNLAALLALEPLYQRLRAWDPLTRVLTTEAGLLRDPRARAAALEELARMQRVHGTGDDADLRRTYQALLSVDVSHIVALEGLERLALEQGDRALLADVDQRFARTISHPAAAAAHFTRLGRSLESINPHAALAAYRSALERDAESIAAIRGLARAADATSDAQALVEALRREASWTRDGEQAADALVRCSQVRLAQLGDSAGALEDAERALERCPEHEQGARLVSDLLREAGQIDHLIALLSRAAGAAKRPERVQGLWRAVARLHADERGDVGAGIAALERTMREREADAGTLLLLGELRMRNRQWEEAHDALIAARDRGPSRDQIVGIELRLAKLFAKRLDEPEAGIDSLRRVLQQDPQNRDALMAMLELCQRAGDNDGRREALVKLLEIAPGPSERIFALLELGKLETAAGRPRDAAKALHQAVVIEGPRGEAAAAYKRVLGDVEPWDRYVEALDEHIQRVRAGELFDDHVRDSFLDAARVRAEIMLKPEEALRTLRTGMIATSGDPLLHLQLAERLGAAGRVDESVAEYQSLARTDPVRPEAWRGMARAYHDAGRKLEAGVALAPLVVLGEANAIESGMSRQRRVQPGTARVGSFDAGVMVSLAAGEVRDEQRVASLMTSVLEGVAKLYPVELERYGVSTRDRLPSDHALRATSDRLAQIFGIEEYELYLHRSPVRDVVVEVSQPPALMVPRYVTELSDEPQVFLLARAFASLARGVHPLTKLGAREIDRLLAAAVQGVAPTFAMNRFAGADLGELYKRLHKTLSRKSRRMLEVASQQYVGNPAVDVERWAATADLTSIRAAALLANDLVGSLDGLERAGVTPAGLRGAPLVRASPIAADLFRFWTSKMAFDLRRAVGIL